MAQGNQKFDRGVMSISTGNKIEYFNQGHPLVETEKLKGLDKG